MTSSRSGLCSWTTARPIAGYDEVALAGLLSELPELEGTGFDEAALSRLLDETRPDELPGADEEVPPRPEQPSTRPGDLYLLGEHRLVCGDATDAETFERLLEGEKAQLLWTDPPYGVDYVGKTKRRLRIDGDSAEGLSSLLATAFARVDEILADGAALYVAHPAGAGGVPAGPQNLASAADAVLERRAVRPCCRPVDPGRRFAASFLQRKRCGRRAPWPGDGRDERYWPLCGRHVERV